MKVQDTSAAVYGEYALFDEQGRLITYNSGGEEVAPVYTGEIDESNNITLTYDMSTAAGRIIDPQVAEEPITAIVYGISGTHNLGDLEDSGSDPVAGLVSVQTSPDRELPAGLTAFKLVDTLGTKRMSVICNNNAGSVTEPAIEDDGALFNGFYIDNNTVDSVWMDGDYSGFKHWINRIYHPKDNGPSAVQSAEIIGQSVTSRNLI